MIEEFWIALWHHFRLQMIENPLQHRHGPIEVVKSIRRQRQPMLCLIVPFRRNRVPRYKLETAAAFPCGFGI